MRVGSAVKSVSLMHLYAKFIIPLTIHLHSNRFFFSLIFFIFISVNYIKGNGF